MVRGGNPLKLERAKNQNVLGPGQGKVYDKKKRKGTTRHFGIKMKGEKRGGRGKGIRYTFIVKWGTLAGIHGAAGGENKTPRKSHPKKKMTGAR